ncbi:hypothetical protein KI387_027127, partial [Taxus chinensis]
MNHLVTNEEEEDIPILIGPDIPSRRDLYFEEELRRFKLQEGSSELLDDENHEEEETVLDDFQEEKSDYMLFQNEELLLFPFGDEDDLSQAIYGETKSACNDPLKILKEIFIQGLLRSAKEIEDPEISLELL